MEQVDFSIVIPVYNSAKTLEELHCRLNAVFTDMNKTHEVIFVNDSSRDNSWDVLKSIKNKSPNVTIINLTRNFGQQLAIICGFQYCTGEYIITLDDDLQNPPEEIPKLYHKIQTGYDAVFGAYETKKDKFYKNLGSIFVRKLNHVIFKIDKLKFSSFRIIRKSVIDEINSVKTHYPYVSGMVLTITRNVDNEIIKHDPRKFGKTNYSLSRLIQLSFNLLINYSSIPIKLVSYTGLFVSVISFFLGLFYLLRKLLSGEGMVGWTSLFVFTSFISTIILLQFFIFGEYLTRLLKEQSGKKHYSIKEVIR